MTLRSKPKISYYAATLTFTACSVTAAYAEEPAANSFDFRGARLGMTIDEFQALAPLGKSRLTEYNERGKKLRDKQTTTCAASKDKINAQLGIVECARAGDDPFTPNRYKYIYTKISYSFGPDTNGTKRLFSILLITDRYNYPEAVSGLRSKWGEGKTVASTVTNGLGQPLPQTTEMWKKPGGTIEVESPCGNVTTICMTYLNTALSLGLANKRSGITGSPASRF